MTSYLISLDGLRLDWANKQITSGAAMQQLSPIQTKLLATLMRNAPSAVSKEELVMAGWETIYVEDCRLLRPHIRGLREKLNGNQVWEIETLRGFGYRLVRRDYERRE